MLSHSAVLVFYGAECAEREFSDAEAKRNNASGPLIHGLVLAHYYATRWPR